MCYFVIAVKREKKRDRAGVEQRPPPSHFVLDFPPKKWPISLFLNGVDIFTFKPFDTKILDFKTNHVFNARRDINMWHAKFTRKS